MEDEDVFNISDTVLGGHDVCPAGARRVAPHCWPRECVVFLCPAPHYSSTPHTRERAVLSTCVLPLITSIPQAWECAGLLCRAPHVTLHFGNVGVGDTLWHPSLLSMELCGSLPLAFHVV